MLSEWTATFFSVLKLWCIHSLSIVLICGCCVLMNNVVELHCNTLKKRQINKQRDSPAGLGEETEKIDTSDGRGRG